MSTRSVNPATGEVLETFEGTAPERILGHAWVFLQWRRYPPTVLAGVEEGMPAFDEETFGPVAAVIRARDEDHALQLANASRFGLGASIWTNDRKRAESLAGDIEVGSVFVNGQVRSDPRLPFGGVKQSGHGRELSEYGIREFTNVKTVWLA